MVFLEKKVGVCKKVELYFKFWLGYFQNSKTCSCMKEMVQQLLAAVATGSQTLLRGRQVLHHSPSACANYFWGFKVFSLCQISSLRIVHTDSKVPKVLSGLLQFLTHWPHRSQTYIFHGSKVFIRSFHFYNCKCEERTCNRLKCFIQPELMLFRFSYYCSQMDKITVIRANFTHITFFILALP